MLLVDLALAVAWATTVLLFYALLTNALLRPVSAWLAARFETRGALEDMDEAGRTLVTLSVARSLALASTCLPALAELLLEGETRALTLVVMWGAFRPRGRR